MLALLLLPYHHIICPLTPAHAPRTHVLDPSPLQTWGCSKSKEDRKYSWA